MSELQATIEFSVELCKFYNVDLFQRGLYQVRCGLRVSPKLPVQIEVSVPDMKKGLSAASTVGCGGACRPFQILYRSEEVSLQDVLIFRCHVLVDNRRLKESLSKAEFCLVLELWFSEQSLATMVLVSSRTLQLNFSPVQGLNYHLPVLFDYFHLSAVTVTIHASLIALHQPYINAPRNTKPWNKLKPSPIVSQSQVDIVFSTSTKCSNGGVTSRMAQAQVVHKEVCEVLLETHHSLQQAFKDFLPLLPQWQQVQQFQYQNIQQRLKGLCDSVKLIDLEEDFLARANSDVAQLCAENIVQWQQFLTTVSCKVVVQQHLAKKHHLLRVRRFAEAFFVLDNPRHSAAGCYDANYQNYLAVSELARRSKYLATLPALPVHCVALDGDQNTMPIIFEDQYQDVVEFARRRSDSTGKKPGKESLGLVAIAKTKSPKNDDCSCGIAAILEAKAQSRTSVLTTSLLKSGNTLQAIVNIDPMLTLPTRHSKSLDHLRLCTTLPRSFLSTGTGCPKQHRRAIESKTVEDFSVHTAGNGTTTASPAAKDRLNGCVNYRKTRQQRFAPSNSRSTNDLASKTSWQCLETQKQKLPSRSCQANCTVCNAKAEKMLRKEATGRCYMTKSSSKSQGNFGALFFFDGMDKECARPAFPRSNSTQIFSPNRDQNAGKFKYATLAKGPSSHRLDQCRPTKQHNNNISYSKTSSDTQFAPADYSHQSSTFPRHSGSSSSGTRKVHPPSAHHHCSKHGSYSGSNSNSKSIKNSSMVRSSRELSCSRRFSSSSSSSDTDDYSFREDASSSRLHTSSSVPYHLSRSGEGLRHVRSASSVLADLLPMGTASESLPNLIKSSKDGLRSNKVLSLSSSASTSSLTSEQSGWVSSRNSSEISSPDGQDGSFENNLIANGEQLRSRLQELAPKPEGKSTRKPSAKSKPPENAKSIDLLDIKVSEDAFATSAEEKVHPYIRKECPSIYDPKRETSTYEEVQLPPPRQFRDVPPPPEPFRDPSPGPPSGIDNLLYHVYETIPQEKINKSQSAVDLAGKIEARKVSDIIASETQPRLPTNEAYELFNKAKADFKSQLNFSGTLYSDLSNYASTMPYFHISDEFRMFSPEGMHLIVCVHGLDGNSADLRLVKTYLELGLPGAHLEFLMSERNQGDTFSDFDTMTDRLVSEILYHVDSCGVRPSRISFVGHSLGNIIIRSALTRPQMKPLLSRLHTFLSLSGPHLGTLYNSSGLVNMGMWFMQKWKKSGSLLQLCLRDAPDVRQSFLYRLSQKSTLHNFKNVLLCGSSQDRYVPLHSARLELCKAAIKDNSSLGTAYREMVHNVVSPMLAKKDLTLVRYDVHHALPHTANALIGRAAHIAVLDSELFIEKFLVVAGLKYFR